MKKHSLSLAIVISFLSIGALADKLPQPTLTANCNGIWGESISNDSSESFSVTGTDAIFKKQDGKITLAGSIETVPGYGPLYLPVYNGSQKITLQGGYAVNVEIKVLKDEKAGDFLIDEPQLVIASELLYKDVPVDSAIISTMAISHQSRWSTDKGANFLNVSGSLPNLRLKKFLNAPNYLNTDLKELVSKSPNEADILQKFGDGKEVVTSVGVECEVEIPWTPTGGNVP